MQRAGSALTTAGNDIDESTAMIAAANTIVQDPDKVGNGLRTIALRLTGTKAAAEALQEMGEETEGMVQTESKLRKTIMDATKTVRNPKGFDILTDSGQYKSTYEILQGIADIWEDIGEMDKATGNTNQNLLLETMAGKNRANILAAILQSPDILQSAYIDSQNSEGSAQEELDKYLESMEGKIQKFQNATQQLSADLISSDLLKFFVDLGTTGVNALDMLAKHANIVTVAVGALAAVLTHKMDAPLLSFGNDNDRFLGVETIVDRIQGSAAIRSDDEDITKFFDREQEIRKETARQQKQLKALQKQRAKAAKAAQESAAPLSETMNVKRPTSKLKTSDFTQEDIDFINQVKQRQAYIKRELEGVGKSADEIKKETERVAKNSISDYEMDQFTKGKGVSDVKKKSLKTAIDSDETATAQTTTYAKTTKQLADTAKTLAGQRKELDAAAKSAETLGTKIEGSATKFGTLTERYDDFVNRTNKTIPIMEGFKEALETEPGKYTNDFKGMLTYIRASGVGLQAMKATLVSIGTQIAGMMASMALAMVAAAALQKILEWAEYFVHYSDHMIENGQEARHTVEELNDAIVDSKNTIQSLGKVKLTEGMSEDATNIRNIGSSIEEITKRYSELKRGVGADNENLYLSEDEYAEFLDISNKLAEAIPDLKYGTDSAGNAILALGDNAKESAEKVKELYDATRNLNASEIEDNFAEGVKGLRYEFKELPKKHASLVNYGGDFNWKNMVANGDDVVNAFRDRVQDARTEGAKDNLRKGLSEVEKYNTETKQLISELTSYTSQFISSREAFGNLDYDLQDAVSKSFALNKQYFADLFDEVGYDENAYKSALYDRFITPLDTLSSDIKKQESLKSLLEQKVGEMTPAEFRANYKEQLQGIFGESYSENIDKMFGFDQQYKQYRKYMNAIIDEFKKDGTVKLTNDDLTEILGMSNNDLELAYNVLIDTDDAIKSFDLLKDKMEEEKKTAVEATNYLNDYVASQGKANSENYTKVADAAKNEATNMARGIRNEDYSRLIGGFSQTTTPTVPASVLIPNYEGLSSAISSYSDAYSNVIKSALSSPEVQNAVKTGADLTNVKMTIDTTAADEFKQALAAISPYFEDLNISQEKFNDFIALGADNVYSFFETFDTQQRAMTYFTDDGLGVYSFMKDVMDATKESKKLRDAFIDVGNDGKLSFKKNEKSINELSKQLNISTEAAGYLLDAAKDIGAVDMGTIYAQAGKNNLSGFLSDLQAVSAAMSEISSNGYLSYEAITNLVTANGAYGDALINTSSGMALNNEELAELNEQAAEFATANIQDSVNQLTREFNKNSDALADFTNNGGNVKQVLKDIEQANGNVEEAARNAGASVDEYTKVWQAYNGNQNIASSIIDLQRQQSEIRASVSLMQEYKNALQTPNLNANFLTTVGGKEGADKLYEQGWRGTDDLIAYAKLIGKNGYDDYDAILNYQDSIERVGKYLTEDASGVRLFFDEAIAKGEELGVTFDDMAGYKLNIDNMEEFADAMGVTTEFAENMVLALHDAGQRDVDLSVISDGIRSDLSNLGVSQLNDEKSFKEAISMTKKMGDNAESALNKIVIGRKALDEALAGADMEDTYALFNETYDDAEIANGKLAASTDLVSESVDGLKNHIQAYREESDAASKTDMFANITDEVRALSYLDVPTINAALGIELDENASRDEIINAIGDVAGMTSTEKLSLKLGVEIPEDASQVVQGQLEELYDNFNELNDLKANPKVDTAQITEAQDSIIALGELLHGEVSDDVLAHFGIVFDENGVLDIEATKASLGQPVESKVTVYTSQDNIDKMTALQQLVNDIGTEHDGTIVLSGSEEAQETVEALADELAELPQQKLIEYGFTPSDGHIISAKDIVNQIGTIDLSNNFKALPNIGNTQNVTVNVTGADKGKQDVDALNAALTRLGGVSGISVNID